MTIEEKIENTKNALAKTKSQYAKRDLTKYLKRLEKEKLCSQKTLSRGVSVGRKT